jgi:hypothetical protein
MWVPAPQRAVDPEQAGIDPGAVTLPDELRDLAAPPVFITGSARSGTTWTFDLFAEHPEVCAIFECWVLTQTHGVTSILTQDHWIPGAREAWVGRSGLAQAAVQLLPYEEMVRDVQRMVTDWLMRRYDPDKHRFLVAKEPIDVRAAAILFPGARFIHVIRDGRDVALSMKRASESWDPSMGVGLPMSWRAEAWRRQVENVRAHRDFLRDRYMEVRFEDMRADVVAATRMLFDFAGIPHGDELLGRIRGNTQLSSYEEKSRDSGFRGGGRRSGWQREFGVRDARGFDRAAGSLLVELGYEGARDWWRRSLPGLGARA